MKQRAEGNRNVSGTGAVEVKRSNIAGASGQRSVQACRSKRFVLVDHRFTSNFSVTNAAPTRAFHLRLFWKTWVYLLQGVLCAIRRGLVVPSVFESVARCHCQPSSPRQVLVGERGVNPRCTEAK